MQNKPIFERNEYLLWAILFAAGLVFVLLVGSIDPIARNFVALSLLVGVCAFSILHVATRKGK